MSLATDEIEPKTEEMVDPFHDSAEKQDRDLRYHAKRKLVLNWTDEDSDALKQIRELASDKYFEIFEETLGLIDELYEKTDNGQNWALLTIQELEAFLMRLSQERISTTLQLNNVKMEALFSKYSLDDEYHDYYLKGSGTNNLREAEAHTKTVEQRYAYYFRYYVYTMCEGLGRDIDSLVKNLSSVLYRRNSNA